MEQNQIRKNKPNIFINGERIYLREVRFSDVTSSYHAWMNDPEVTQYTESHFKKWSIKELKNYVRKIKNNPDYLFLAIISKNKDSHLGNIKIGPINRIHRFADIAIIIGEKSFWGKGFATEALKLVVSFAFNKLSLHKLTAGTFANNIGSIKAFSKAGFSIEGKRRQKYFYKGRYIDEVLLGVFRK